VGRESQLDLPSAYQGMHHTVAVGILLVEIEGGSPYIRRSMVIYDGLHRSARSQASTSTWQWATDVATKGGYAVLRRRTVIGLDHRLGCIPEIVWMGRYT
jgi:hypothetical protein